MPPRSDAAASRRPRSPSRAVPDAIDPRVDVEAAPVSGAAVVDDDPETLWEAHVHALRELIGLPALLDLVIAESGASIAVPERISTPQDALAARLGNDTAVALVRAFPGQTIVVPGISDMAPLCHVALSSLAVEEPECLCDRCLIAFTRSRLP